MQFARLPGTWVAGACLLLGAGFFAVIASGEAGPEPARWLLHQSGIAAVVLLVATLAVSPLRRLAKRAALLRWRRPLGLAAFAFASLHVIVYAAPYQGLSLPAIIDDIAKRPFIIAGALAWLLLVPLALTSTRNMQRQLGAARWQQLHRLVYPAALLAVAHYAIGQKSGWGPAGPLGLLLALLLAERLWFRRPSGTPPPGPGKNRERGC